MVVGRYRAECHQHHTAVVVQAPEDKVVVVAITVVVAVAVAVVHVVMVVVLSTPLSNKYMVQDKGATILDNNKQGIPYTTLSSPLQHTDPLRHSYLSYQHITSILFQHTKLQKPKHILSLSHHHHLLSTPLYHQ